MVRDRRVGVVLSVNIIAEKQLSMVVGGGHAEFPGVYLVVSARCLRGKIPLNAFGCMEKRVGPYTL